MSAPAFDAFGALVAYPGADFGARFDAALEALEAEGPEWADRLTSLARRMADGNAAAIEELYTRTFDLNPKCALETGWHLYGEDYDRGAFLVYLRSTLRAAGLAENGELPDHLSQVLPLLGRLESEEAAALSRRHVLPAVHRILEAFRETDNPYRDLLQGVSDLLSARFGPADEVPASAFACPAPYEGESCVCRGTPAPSPE